MKNTLEPFIHTKVLVLDQQATCATAARAMRDRGVGSAVVSDGKGHMIGIVTDRDLVCRVMAENLVAETPVSSVVTGTLHVIRESDTLDKAISVMTTSGIRRVPVIKDVKKGHRCVGFVTLDDLLASRMLTTRQISMIVREQVKRRVGATRARVEVREVQTYTEFIKNMIHATSIDRDKTDSIVRFLIKEVAKRLPITSATEFSALLPRVLQEELISLPPGPNSKITARTILETLKTNFRIENEEATELIRDIWRALGDTVGSGELDDVLIQLPSDISKLLIQDEYEERRPIFLSDESSGSHMSF